MRAVREHLPTHVLTGRELDEPAFAAVLHTHPQWELTLIRQGCGVRIVGDHIGAYRAGDLVLLGPDLPHCWTSSEGTTERSQATVVHFSPDIAALTASLPDTTPLPSLLAASRRGVVWSETPEALTTTLRAAAAPTPDDPRLGALFTLLEQLSHIPWSHLCTVSRPAVSAAAQRRIDTVTDYVLDHHARTVDLATAAERASMAPSAFSRFFHNSTGRTFTDYVTDVRISSACALLADSDLTVTAIAERAGFRNLANFNRQFRRHKGLTPTSYRRTAKGRTAQHPPGPPKTPDLASR